MHLTCIPKANVNYAQWLGPGSNCMPSDIDEFNKFVWSVASRYPQIGAFEVRARGLRYGGVAGLWRCQRGPKRLLEVCAASLWWEWGE